MINKIKSLFSDKNDSADSFNDIQHKFLKYISKEKFLFLYQNFNLIENLILENKLKISVCDDKSLIFKIDNVSLLIENGEEIYIFNEVFNNGCYNLISNKESVIIDIGMNVGISSLFFANNSNIKKIYGFEPFSITYNQAINNFNLNPTLKSKIIHNNIGLGIKDEVLSVKYYPDWKGSMSIYEIPEYAKEHIEKSEQQIEKIQIKNVINELTPIINEHKKENLIMKVDCEGSEYDIFDQIDKSNLFCNVNAIMMEWHLKGPNPIAKILIKNNFSVLSLNLNSKSTGIIYAFK